MIVSEHANSRAREPNAVGVLATAVRRLRNLRLPLVKSLFELNLVM
jgi:hypothetical protein